MHWSQVLSREWWCSWSNADRQCSTYIWVIIDFIGHWGAAYIRDLAVIALKEIHQGHMYKFWDILDIPGYYRNVHNYNYFLPRHQPVESFIAWTLLSGMPCVKPSHKLHLLSVCHKAFTDCNMQPLQDDIDQSLTKIQIINSYTHMHNLDYLELSNLVSMSKGGPIRT